MKITIFQRAYLRDESGHFRNFSSEPEYDRAMSSVFTYFALVTVEEARELSGILSQEYNGEGERWVFEPVSFAVVINANGADIGVPLVFWMHGKAVMKLSQTTHEIIYDYAFPNFRGRT